MGRKESVSHSPVVFLLGNDWLPFPPGSPVVPPTTTTTVQVEGVDLKRASHRLRDGSRTHVGEEEEEEHFFGQTSRQEEEENAAICALASPKVTVIRRAMIIITRVHFGVDNLLCSFLLFPLLRTGTVQPWLR